MKEEIKSRIELLRNEIKRRGLNAIIIPQSDPHQSEYLASHWQVRRYFSGFTGSAGTLVVTLSEALLWTDSRYFLQATQQLEGTGIILMKDGLPATPSIENYLKSVLVRGNVIGVDGWLFSINKVNSMIKTFKPAGIKLDTTVDVVDTLWKDRPSLPLNKIFEYDIKYAGKDAAVKIKEVLARTSGVGVAFISALDEIAWTLNIRCNDVNCNPVATGFLYLSSTGSVLFTMPEKVDDSVKAYLQSKGVKVLPYSEVAKFLSEVKEEEVYIDGERSCYAVLQLLGDKAVIGNSPVAMLKSCKNEVEIQGTHDAMVRDGVALVHAFRRIEAAMAEGKRLTEMCVADILQDERSKQPLYFDLSFETIAGYGPHGAIVHYEADEESNAVIGTDSLLLIDSGAQYLDGTTDITRTICLGTPTAEQRRDFTLVMKGHIALGTAIFPEETRGDQLDALARQFLWKNGLSYLHGTGHGVGHFLNVHEGPQSIRLNTVPYFMTPGMITSNEPGLYLEGKYGIRCENLVLTVPAFENQEFGKFYKFETLTLFPFDLKLFDTQIMTDEEIAWVNNYHKKVYAKLSSHLDEESRAWLAEKTKTLTR
ncbi:MAG: aminopeptidase P family protein [Bacteroidales bacterium]|nr:aminopeptidase P family protein [Bacteroidales bacterium]